MKACRSRSRSSSRSALIVRWMYSRCSASSVSTLIDRNFNAVNGRRFMPNLVCRKKTGPGDSRLIRIAAITKTGAVNTRRTVAPTTSTTRFVMREDRRSRAGGTVRSGRPSSRWMSALGPTSSKRRGTRSTMTFSSRSERTSDIVRSSASPENATITRSTSLFSTIPATSSSPPSSGRSATSGRSRGGCRRRNRPP